MHRDHQNTYYTYVYRITHLWHLIHYYGVRYAIKKNSGIALEDLKIYRGSSTDIDFKEELKLYPERFKFKIIKVFRTDKSFESNNNFDSNGCIIEQACNLETRLHKKFQVNNNPRFYNRHISTGFMTGSGWDGTRLWDLENDCEYFVESAKEFRKTFGQIDSLLRHNTIFGRFCLIEHNLQKNKSEYLKLNTIYTWWRYFDGILESKEVYHKDCNREIGHKFVQVISGEYISINNWYLDKALCISNFNLMNTRYNWWKYINGILTSKSLLYKDCKEVAVHFVKVINNTRVSCDGWYLDKEKCILDYTLYNTLYIWWRYTNGTLESKEVYHKDCNREISKSFTEVTKSKQTSCDGWYLDKEKCMSDYIIQNTMYTWKHNTTNETKTIMYCDCRIEIGVNFVKVLSGLNSSCRGWRLINKTT